MVKSYSLTLKSYIKFANGLEIIRGFTCFLWMFCNYFENDMYFITWFMVLINFLVSLSGFKAFDFTRSYVSLIYSTIKDSLIFLIIYLYSVIALAILYNITVDREIKS